MVVERVGFHSNFGAFKRNKHSLEGFTIALIIRSLDLRWSADAVRNRVLLTLHSAGMRDEENLYQGVLFNGDYIQ